ncbi:hypothetical protein PcaKH15_17450 [Parageobacillus caldoxylosilyticus]|nr:hypothetical protein PcaKH15_17450 [Parageobacillus caldoxylosilyticus]BDG39621.1 hypothetical protein PcaKH16_17600 [Parageobacillus caldoxylosilyticus]BDG43394.1 hypothetical protein PcaKH35_17390 [Parageobacillus caldoxylosilyticus]
MTTDKMMGLRGIGSVRDKDATGITDNNSTVYSSHKLVKKELYVLRQSSAFFIWIRPFKGKRKFIHFRSFQKDWP